MDTHEAQIFLPIRNSVCHWGAGDPAGTAPQPDMGWCAHKDKAKWVDMSECNGRCRLYKERPKDTPPMEPPCCT